MAATKDFMILQGKTFALAVRWEVPPIKRVPITAITALTGAARITAAGHNVPEGWRVVVTNVKGMSEINASDANKVKDGEYTPATVIDADTVELNEVNAAGFKPYLSGGFLQYNTPVILTGFTARMSIKDKIGGTVLFSLTTENGRIAVDATASTIKLLVTADDTALLTFKSGVYELELVSADVTPVVTTLLSGKITVAKEVTT